MAIHKWPSWGAGPSSERGRGPCAALLCLPPQEFAALSTTQEAEPRPLSHYTGQQHRLLDSQALGL